MRPKARLSHIVHTTCIASFTNMRAQKRREYNTHKANTKASELRAHCCWSRVTSCALVTPPWWTHGSQNLLQLILSTFLYQNLQGTRLFWNGIVYSTILKKIIQVCTILRVKEKFWFFWHPDIMVHKYYFCVKTSAEYFSENHEQESRESKSRGSCKFTPPLFVLVGPQF